MMGRRLNIGRQSCRPVSRTVANWLAIDLQIESLTRRPVVDSTDTNSSSSPLFVTIVFSSPSAETSDTIGRWRLIQI